MTALRPPLGRFPRLLPFLFAIAITVLFASNASAHAIKVFAWIGGAKGGIQGEVFAPGGGPIPGASIDAYDADDHLIASAKSDDEGEFALEVEAAAGLRIVATTDDGHRAEYVMPDADHDHDHADADHDHDAADHDHADMDHDHGDGDAEDHDHADEVPAPAHDHDHATMEDHGHTHGEVSLEAEVDALVHQVIELRRELAEMRSQIGVRDVVGGTGYILGLTGIWFFLLGRRRKE